MILHIVEQLPNKRLADAELQFANIIATFERADRSTNFVTYEIVRSSIIVKIKGIYKIKNLEKIVSLKGAVIVSKFQAFEVFRIEDVKNSQDSRRVRYTR